MVGRIMLALFLCVCCAAPAFSQEAKGAKPQATLKFMRNGGTLLVFEVAASVPIHRPAPEHFQLTEIGKDNVPLSFSAGAERRHEKTLYQYNATWQGGTLHLTNLSVATEDRMGRVNKVSARRLVDLYGEAELKPGKRYRLTWACWPVGAAKALEVSCEFDLAQKPAPASKQGLVALELTAANTTVKSGQAIGWSAHLVNRGTTTLTLVLPGDGSESGWRTPLIEWHIAGEDNRFKGISRRCGNVNPLQPEEVVTLKPGERVKLGEWLGQPSLSGEGKYLVSLEYANLPDLKWKGVPLGQHDSATMAKVRRSSRVTVVSNRVEITIQK